MIIAAVLLSRLFLQATTPIRGVSYAPDGRIAVSIRGDLWTLSPSGVWKRITSGAAWDREPTFTPDGKSVVFSSAQGAAGWDIYIVGADGGEPRKLTDSPEWETEPAAASGERVVFVRGRGSEARLWMRDSAGLERRLTNGRAAERWPSFSPDGRHVAYVVVTETGRRLVTRDVNLAPNARGADTTVSTMSGAEHPAWSPDGSRLSFTVAGARAAVYVAPTDGRYANLIATKRAESAWSPDGRRIALAEIPDNEVGYNGDPDRVGDRDVDLLATGGSLSFIEAPAAMTAALPAPVPAAPGADDRAAFNAAAFDDVWQRTARLYYDSAVAPDRRARWNALRDKFRPRALAASDEDQLRDAIHAMLRERPPYRQSATGRAAVSSAHPVATAAGVEILAKGGNVVDAAAAVSFALGVVEPDASGPGGYGQMLVYRKDMASPQLIEFMARVPEEATLSNADLTQNGRLPDDGPVLANVPGTVAAMHLAFRKYGSGKVTWADVLAPAIRAARDGYALSEGTATTLATEREHFAKYESSRALFFKDGKPKVAGDTVKNPDLAWTLEQIARGGADAFYKGEIARRIVGDLRGKGNAMKLTDLARYFAAEREPVAMTYRGYSLYSSAPPVAGGAQLAATLNNLEQFANPRPYTEDASTLHAMISAWLLSPSTRNRIADPGLWPTTTEPFTNKDTARTRWRCFDPDKAVNADWFKGDTLTCGDKASAANGGRGGPDTESAGAGAEEQQVHSQGTTAFTVADADGNVVAVTQTLGTWGGNFYVSPGLGFIYNDKLGSYGTDPSGYGARLPYARHGSTIAPTIVFEGNGTKRKPIAAVGAAGNNWITSAVYQTLIGIMDQKLDPQAALELPRFIPSRGGGPNGNGGNAERATRVQVEDGLSPAVMKRLEEMGYRLQRVSLMGELREGYGAAVVIKDGKVTAGADPRRAGAAGAVP